MQGRQKRSQGKGAYRDTGSCQVKAQYSGSWRWDDAEGGPPRQERRKAQNLDISNPNDPGRRLLAQMEERKQAHFFGVEGRHTPAFWPSAISSKAGRSARP
eukprot:8737386-Heterocapsa_arctica.AAC.1